MKLLFLGSPGVGKGTYAQVLKEELHIPHISGGDLLRDEAKKGTELGKQVEKIMKVGGLVDDKLMLDIIKERITQKDCKNGFILDGFPRTTKQAEMLSEMTDISHVLNFKADDEVIIERLSGRIVCRQCQKIYHKKNLKPKVDGTCDNCEGEIYQREDDKPHAIKNRLEVYQQKTAPLIDHYKGKGLLIEVVINKPFEQVKDTFIGSIKSYLEGKTEQIPDIK